MWPELNVQNQQKIEWPAKSGRGQSVSGSVAAVAGIAGEERIADLQKAIQSARNSHMNKNTVAKLQSMAATTEKSAASAKTPADSKRLQALAQILKHPSA